MTPRYPVSSDDRRELDEQHDADDRCECRRAHDASCGRGWLGDDTEGRPVICRWCHPYLVGRRTPRCPDHRSEVSNRA